MRVTNWRRWQRTKSIVGAICFLVALASIGGLESEATEPFPWIEGFFIFLPISLAIMLNVTHHERNGHPR